MTLLFREFVETSIGRTHFKITLTVIKGCTDQTVLYLMDSSPQNKQKIVFIYLGCCGVRRLVVEILTPLSYNGVSHDPVIQDIPQTLLGAVYVETIFFLPHQCAERKYLG